MSRAWGPTGDPRRDKVRHSLSPAVIFVPAVTVSDIKSASRAEQTVAVAGVL